MVLTDDDELLDLVDDQDQVIGTIRRKHSPALINSGAGHIRGVASFIRNSKGQLWIPRRPLHKKLAPGGLDYGVAEHVQSGEDYVESLIRGFEEELFLGVTEADLEYLGILPPLQGYTYFFTKFFVYHSDHIERYNKDDFTSYEWLFPKEVAALIDAGTPAKTSFKIVLEKFLL